MAEIGDSQILDFLKSKYISKPSVKVSSSSESKEEVPVGEESEYSGAEAENQFLLNKLNKVQGELIKWLDVLKQKINN